MQDTVLEYSDHLFYLPIGLTIANSDVVMDDAQPFTEPCKAARKLSTVVGLDLVWLAPIGNQVIIQELGLLLAMQRGHSADLHPLGEWIHGNKEVTISILVLGKWIHHGNALSEEWCTTFVHPV